MTTIELTTKFAVITCGECGIVYGLPERFRQQHYDKGTAWTCPGCGIGWGYGGKGKVQQLEAELQRAKKDLRVAEAETAHVEADLQEERESHATTEARRRAEKAAKTRIKNRVGRGVCPCCSRTFENLARHMAGQHPEYSTEGGDA